MSLLEALERRLLDRNREPPERIVAWLTDEFIEFGSSGRMFNKAQTLEWRWGGAVTVVLH